MQMPASTLSRAQLIRRAGLALAAAGGLGAGLTSPASAGVEEDLALVRLAAAGEIVGIEFYDIEQASDALGRFLS